MATEESKKKVINKTRKVDKRKSPFIIKEYKEFQNAKYAKTPFQEACQRDSAPAPIASFLESIEII